MSAFLFNLRGTNFTIVDSGSALNAEFVKLYEQFLDNQPSNHLDFDKAAIEYFDTRIKELPFNEDFFTSFTSIWLFFTETHRFREAESIWEFALSTVKHWEQLNVPRVIHKGSPYYFGAVTAILSGDLDRGFLIMHQAFEEDKKNSGGHEKELPAYAFVTLDYKQRKQYFYEEVCKTADFLDTLVKNYRGKFNTTLTLEEFRNKFFDMNKFEDPIFLLVYILFKSKSIINKVDRNLRLNALAGLIEAGILFDLCLVIETVIKHISKIKGLYSEQVIFLSKQCKIKKLDEHYITEISRRFKDNNIKVLTEILNGTWKFKDGTTLSLIETDIALSLCLRNFSAHNIVSVPEIYQQFEDIFQRVINVLFFSVEKLYS